MLWNIPYIMVAVIVVIGLYAMMFKRNIIKIIIGVTLVESGVNLFLITTGYRTDSIAPIFTNALSENMVLPTPQALTLTSIVIGLAVLALMLSMAIAIYRHYKTLDSRKIVRLKG
ncbi:cation:proton antiporter subunit C [Candidatus Woesearchaeota archaeon]|nr:cation:proton antiporter subunit C [Candidatus Woesearchaeota archaeon]